VDQQPAAAACERAAGAVATARRRSAWVPEAVLGPRGARWAEVLEESAKVFLDVRELDEAVFATLESGKCGNVYVTP